MSPGEVLLGQFLILRILTPQKTASTCMLPLHQSILPFFLSLSSWSLSSLTPASHFSHFALPLSVPPTYTHRKKTLGAGYKKYSEKVTKLGICLLLLCSSVFCLRTKTFTAPCAVNAHSETPYLSVTLTRSLSLSPLLKLFPPLLPSSHPLPFFLPPLALSPPASFSIITPLPPHHNSSHPPKPPTAELICSWPGDWSPGC